MNINNCKLKNISNKKYLSELLKIPLPLLKDIRKYYSTTPFLFTNNKGKTRTLYNPSEEHKKILRRINFQLQKIDVPEYILGGIKGKSHIQNGFAHKDSLYFCLIDLKDFFPTTKDSYVYRFFRYTLNNSEDIAKILTLLVTEVSPDTNKNILPQGYPTSPILSYLCYNKMFETLHTLALKNEMVLSCYYDDITFSSTKFINKQFKSEVIKVIGTYELVVNYKKTRVMKINNGVNITGTIIKKNNIYSPNRLQLKMIRHFKELESNYLNPTKIKENRTLINKVRGCVSAIKAIEKSRKFPHISNRLKEIKQEIDNLSFTNKHNNKR